jgi:hypothetical protein
MPSFSSLRPFALLLCLPAVMTGCGSAAIPAASKTADSSKIQKRVAEESRSDNYRSVLIGELKNLQAMIASDDKHQVGQLFSFPLADSLVSIVIDDPGYKLERKKQHGQMTRDMFEKYFSKMSVDWQLDEFRKLFEHINLNDLQLKDTLEYKDIKQNEPCNKIYSIFIRDSVVHLIYGTSGNPDYVNKTKPKGDEEDIGCEYSTFWLFHFDGRKLMFRRQLAAG